MGDEISTLRILGFGKILYKIYIYKYTCTKIRPFLSISIHLNTKYIYIKLEACDFFKGWWRDSSSLLPKRSDSHVVY